MPQNTNSAAFIRSKPLENTNLGAIVSEHVRFYAKRKDDRDAQGKALEAQAAKLRLTRNKLAKDTYDGLSPEENEGFLNSQIMDAFESKKEMLWKLSEAYADGDVESGKQLSDWARKFENLSGVNKIYGAKAQELQTQEGQGTFNKFLDKSTKGFTASTGTGKYTIDPETLDMTVYDEESGTTRLMRNGELMSNDYLSSSYHKPSNFVGNGETIAKNLLDNLRGSKQETPQTRADGIKLVNGLFASDPVETQSFYAQVRQSDVKDKDGNVIKFNNPDGSPIPLGNLNPVQKTKLQSLYYDNYVQPQLVPTTPKLTGGGGDKSNKPTTSDKINISTSKTGVPSFVTNPLIKKGDPHWSPKLDTEVYNIADTKSKVGNGTETINKIYYNTDTQEYSAEVSLYEPVTGDSGTRTLADGRVVPTKGKKLGKFVNTRTIRGDAEMSRIANVLGVFDAEGLVGLVDGARTKQQERQALKKGEQKNSELSAEEMLKFMGN